MHERRLAADAIGGRSARARSAGDSRRSRSDVVITDSVAPWGHWVGEKLDLPVVTSVPTFAFNRHVLAYACRARRPAEERAACCCPSCGTSRKPPCCGGGCADASTSRGPGHDGDAHGATRTSTSSTRRGCFSRASRRSTSGIEFVGPSFGPRADGRRRFRGSACSGDFVYVSLGTLFNADPAFYRHCFEAFRRRARSRWSCRSARTCRMSQPRRRRRRTSSCSRYVPQLEVLARASAFVSHGGMNSVSESLAATACRWSSFRRWASRRSSAGASRSSGAGLMLTAPEVSGSRLRAAVDGLLSDPGFRTQAAGIRESFRAAGGVDRATEAITTFVHRWRSKTGAAPHIEPRAIAVPPHGRAGPIIALGQRAGLLRLPQASAGPLTPDAKAEQPAAA